MPDQTPVPSPPTTPAAKPPAGPTIQIAEEFCTAKKNLPPAKVVLIAVAGVIVVVLIVVENCELLPAVPPMLSRPMKDRPR